MFVTRGTLLFHLYGRKTLSQRLARAKIRFAKLKKHTNGGEGGKKGGEEEKEKGRENDARERRRIDVKTLNENFEIKISSSH